MLVRRASVHTASDCPECGHKVSDQAEACPSCGRRLSDQVSRLEAELTRIDAEWKRQRKALMRTFHGGERVPTKGEAVVGVVVPVVLGLVSVVPLWVAAIRRFGPDLKTLAAGLCALVFFFLLGLGIGGYLYWRAVAYEKAKVAYWQRRETARKLYGG